MLAVEVSSLVLYGLGVAVLAATVTWDASEGEQMRVKGRIELMVAKWTLVVVLVVGSLVGCGGDEDTLKQQPQATQPASFAVWYAPGAPDDTEALAAMLTEGGEATVKLYETSEAWMAADADVLVIRGIAETWSTTDDELLWDHDFEPLKRRRVLGIGREAGVAFGSIGLDVRGGGGASSDESEPTIRLGSGRSVPHDLADARIVAFRASALPGGPPTWDCAGLHLPKTEHLVTQVEGIARWADDAEYAPIARQGNFVLCGINADIRAWTPEFTSVLREIAVALARSPDVPFRLSEWEITPPGTYEFELATAGDTEDASGKTFFFKFSDPVLFTAELAMSRGGEVTMSIYGQAANRPNEYVEAKEGELLALLVPVMQRNLTANGDRYWELSVTNFDYEVPAACTLRITPDPKAVLRFPDGTAVSLVDPPQDESTVRKLIGLLSSDDRDVALRAEAALIMIGEPAVPILEAAEKAAEGDLSKTIWWVTYRITERY